MSLIAPLPAETRAKLRQNSHPGLLLDKYVESWDATALPGKLSERVQKPALESVARLSQDAPPGLDLTALRSRRQGLFRALQAQCFSCVTCGPLTLHLARASALENAGICLHPLYGFVYLPGSGLKGMARAYAETVWLPAQHDKAAAQASCAAVFGSTDCSGTIVFHDAWPVKWPRLIVDILNNHHADYYQNAEPPGDWENPVPVYFLAVERDTEFEFALAKRRADVSDALLDQAREWLLGALCHLGAGAKTNTGYGTFRPLTGQRPTLISTRHATFEATLELVTPAFLAGAQQEAEDCDLRPATLRGLLRWWWRTMHAGFVDPSTLLSLEAAVWGDTIAAGAVGIAIVESQPVGPCAFDYKDGFGPKPAFARDQGLAPRPDGRTTQGLFYASYGMDEISRGQQRHRYYLDAGSTFRLRIAATDAEFLTRRKELKDPRKRSAAQVAPASHVLDQALAALWLLCHFGGVGSKSRKGFGSLEAGSVGPQQTETWSQIRDLEDCRALAAHFRSHLGLPNSFDEKIADSASLGTESWLPELPSIPVPWDRPWKIMDEIGFAYQAFAQYKRHDREKVALGLPRKIHGPRDDGPMRNQTRDGWQRPEWLDCSKRDRKTAPKDARHASPIQIHVSREPAGTYVVRVCAFPSKYLPNLEISRGVLAEFLSFFERKLKERAALPPGPGGGGRSGPRRPDDRGGAQRPPQGPPPARTISLPILTREELLQRLSSTSPPQALFRVVRRTAAGNYDAQRLRAANVAAGYQGDGGRRLTEAPDGLAEGSIVRVSLENDRLGNFVEAVGRLPPPQAPPKGPQRGRR